MAQGPEQLAGWQRAAIDATIACAQTALAGAEELLRLNIQAARTALEQHARAAHALLGAADPQDLVRLRSGLARETLQHAAAYAQEVYELVSETEAQMEQYAGRRLADLNQEVVDCGGQVRPGAEVTVAAVKSSLAASAAMMENLTRARRELAGLSDAALRAAAVDAARTADPMRSARR